MNKSKVSLTLKDLYDATCMTHNQFSNFHCIYTIIQVVHTKFIKVVLTEYLAFNSLSKMIQEQAAAVIIITLISEKNKSRKKRKKKRRVCVKLWLKQAFSGEACNCMHTHPHMHKSV